jgi:transposase
VIGLDEWAWRRGRRYGTMIVDLERNTVVDLLPDRDAGSVAGWLHAHPGVEIAARDRAEVFSEGVRQGAPEAVHVVDRWHLLCNLSTALQGVVAGHHAVIRSSARAMQDEGADAVRVQVTAERPPTAAERRQGAKHAPRAARHAELMRLAEAGASVAGLARTLGMDRKTVRAWLRQGGPPRWTKPSRPTALDPYHAYLDRRWSEGCRNAAVLARELHRMGADVRPRVVRTWATRRRREGADVLDTKPGGATALWRPPTVNRTTRLLQAEPGTLTGEDRRFVERLLVAAPALARTVALARRLGTLLRRRSDESLEAWLDEAQDTPLAAFAAGLRREADAVRAAIETPWSTSPVEGQISRLKMIKRSMFGRAGFDLLRQRVLAA